MMRRRLFFLAALCATSISQARAGDDPHLPFFRANRDWVLRALESLKPPAGTPGMEAQAWKFDPFKDESAWARLQAVQASLDSATSIGDLGVFRASLDSLLLAARTSGARLDSLDRCFVAHLRTSLAVTLGAPAGLEVERVEAALDGEPLVTHALSAEEQAALAAGGVLEIAHRVVEPRAQKLEVRAWTRGAAAPSRTEVVVDPAPDLLSVVHLDLVEPQAPARLVRSTLGGSD
jgi:hypothetical protein